MTAKHWLIDALGRCSIIFFVRPYSLIRPLPLRPTLISVTKFYESSVSRCQLKFYAATAGAAKNILFRAYFIHAIFQLLHARLASCMDTQAPRKRNHRTSHGRGIAKSHRHRCSACLRVCACVCNVYVDDARLHLFASLFVRINFLIGLDVIEIKVY